MHPDNSPTLRIALIRQSYRTDGGAERFVSRALNALAQRGAEITLFARKWESQPGIRFETCNPVYLGRLSRDRGFARAVCKRLASQSFDFVQSHERLTCCDIYRAGDGVHQAWLERRNGGTLRWQDRLAPYHRYVMQTEQAMFESQRLRAVICNSNMVRNEILERFTIIPDKLHVIYNGVDTERFHPRHRGEREERLRALGIPSDVPIFLFVGSGFARKGLQAALEALALVTGSPHLIVLGKDKHAERYVALAEKLGLVGRVHWAGTVNDPAPWYGLAYALILPTTYDPFPNVVLEALASGLAVITTSGCGGAEMIDAEKNGFVRDDTEGLRDALAQLCDPVTAQRMGDQARRTAEPCTLDAMSEKLLTLYAALAAT